MDERYLLPDDPVVVHHEGLNPIHEGESVQLPDLVVTEVDAVVLVQGRSEVLDHGNLEVEVSTKFR